MSLKETIRRFRAWQKDPTKAPIVEPEEHQCANCGNVFTGNYCPACGQEATVGHITWKSVGRSILKVWGIESRSLPYTLLQLLLRPGYLISDYLRGRRQYCYPPVNLLFITAIIYTLVLHLMGVNYSSYHYTDNEQVAGYSVIYEIADWMTDHPEWGAIAMAILFVIPTWFFFRFAPRYPRHTLAEGVFIQLFMATLFLLSMLSTYTTISNLALVLIPLFYYIAYRQLFGYRFWGTLWRLLLSFIVIFLLLILLVIGAKSVYDVNLTRANIFGLLESILILTIILTVGYLIGKMTAKRPTAHNNSTDTQRERK